MKNEKALLLHHCLKRWKVDVEKGLIWTQKGLVKTEDELGFKRVYGTYKGKSSIFGVQEVIAYVGGLDIVGKNKRIKHINGDITDNRLSNLKVIHSLTDEEVRTIRRLYNEKIHTTTELAQMYEKSSESIINVIKRKTYKHIN